ncbi:MAG: AAA family ATPase [Nitrospira sp.]|nr:AAA family ATPase [Nitrospira sp.]
MPRDGATATPRLYRDMVLVLRKRVAGIANAVDAIIDDIDHQEVFPPSLAQITGTMTEWENAGLGDGSGSGSAGIAHDKTPGADFGDDDILLAKEANDEQLQIIRWLEHSGSVIVQGPPGTGKTHTIGNLIGHLLAQGKSILVTAQTAKALRVVRDKVPEVLQPLAVSVLGSDQDARRQLESSMGSITERLTSDTADSLLQKARQFETERGKLLTQTTQLTHKLREALENEYREIVVGEMHFTPSDAARFVSANREAQSWIPAPIKLESNLNLSEQELVRLYALSTSYTAEEEQDARYPLPELATLPSERQFQIMVSEYTHLTTTDLTHGTDRWQPTDNESESLEKVANELATEFSDDLRLQSWRPYAIIAGIHGGTERAVWKRLIANIEEAAEATARNALGLNHDPQLSDALPVHKQRQITIEICEYIDGGGKLGFLQLATRSEWRQFIKTTSVTAGKPNHRDHFEALRHVAELEHLRAGLELPWNSMIGKHIQQPFNGLGSAPELACRALIPEIRRCLDWHASVWVPLATRLKTEGLKLDYLIASLPREASHISEYLIIERLASSILPLLIATEAGRRKLRECEAGFSQLANLATQVDPTSPDRGCTGRIIAAVRSRSPEAYTAALKYARRLHAVKPLVAERDALARKLSLVAPGWAEQIAHRVPPHHTGAVPGDFAMAWRWRQLHDTLADRDKLDAHELQQRIDRTRETLRQVTEWLIDAKAWGKQLERLQGNHAIRQALIGWLDTTKRLISTRQLDRRQTLLSEARKLMKKCANAVPVWIMPISIMAESFDPRTTRFDVVIIDEASQADLNALIPLYLGKQIIVVGDHEQVTPLGVGKGQTILENLRKSMLQDIPNSHLFDNLSSIYDISRQSFGDAIRLVEHFRCVPEIIAFSNKLSYEGKIRPLRESNSTDIRPACVGWQVDGVREGDINKSEARRIIDTIKAMILHHRYAHKTIGIISMLGEAQALLIQSMLHKEISGTEIEKRRIQAGISGEFQGDERDIMFLSMVDSSSDEGPLRATGEGAFELIKKRYNVAASRARDQMWVIHSFDPDLHLKDTDLRRKLLQHIRDPLASLRAFNQEIGKTESPFEREVLKRLTDAGYQVKSQWQVGYYRIDMVVKGAGKRLAIECDGDRYHPMEKMADDMARQTILERLGWKFVRIRGSAFYRDPDLAMRLVLDRLRELGIPPEGNSNEAPSSDMTLIHELDNLIRNSFEGDSDEPVGEGTGAKSA